MVAAMRFARSAGKHGIRPADAEHVLRNYIRVFDQGEIAMFIGPAIDGTVLEVGVVEDDEDPRIIHAMPVRRKFWP